jgi:chemotaxis signal transduction protein
VSDHITNRASALRDEFDRGFALAPAIAAAGHRDFLCVQVGGEPSVIPLAEIASLHADLGVAALPTRAPELCGVASIRGEIVPVYDLRIALGRTGAAPLRWTVLLRARPVGFGFERYDGHVRIADSAIARATRPGYLRGQIAIGDQPRSIIDLHSVLTAIETRWQRASSTKEP